MAETLGEQIRITRISLGWSQVYLANKAGTSKSVISSLELGKNTNPSIRTLWKVGNALGMPLSNLLNVKSLNSTVNK
ncbi:MAG: helix-turn-helix domain-containing protein [Syntrophomonas sp.]